MSKEVRTWAMLGGFMEIADTPGNEAPSRYTRYVRETDHKEVVDALLAERDRLKEALAAMLEIHGVTQRYADTHIEIPQSWVDVSDFARAALQGEQP